MGDSVLAVWHGICPIYRPDQLDTFPLYWDVLRASEAGDMRREIMWSQALHRYRGTPAPQSVLAYTRQAFQEVRVEKNKTRSRSKDW